MALYVCTCMYVAIRRKRAYHACANTRTVKIVMMLYKIVQYSTMCMTVVGMNTLLSTHARREEKVRPKPVYETCSVATTKSVL